MHVSPSDNSVDKASRYLVIAYAIRPGQSSHAVLIELPRVGTCVTPWSRQPLLKASWNKLHRVLTGANATDQ